MYPETQNRSILFLPRNAVHQPAQPSSCQADGRDDRADRPSPTTMTHCCVILDVATDPESVSMARIVFPPLTTTVLQVDGLPPSV
jgi:hypothetical protein